MDNATRRPGDSELPAKLTKNAKALIDVPQLSD